MNKTRKINKNKYNKKHTLKMIKRGNEKHITIKNPWFNYIKKGDKIIEGRLNKGIFKSFTLGEKVVWVNNNNKVETYINYIKKYNNFSDMLKNEGIKNVLPGVDNINDGIKIYRKYYSKKQEDDNGVMAIGVSLKKPVIHNGKLQSPHYENIRDGLKIYEMRVYDEKRKQMSVGDIWEFRHNDNKDEPILKTLITEIKIYKSFNEAITEKGYKSLLPNTKNDEEAIKIYESFNNGKYKTDALKYGVVSFKLKVF